MAAMLITQLLRPSRRYSATPGNVLYFPKEDLMRKIPLIATLVALGLAGTAYAATVVTQVYVVTAKVTKKSGTKAHPKPFGASIGYTVKPTPSSDRPNVVKTVVTTIAGVRVHPNAFPTCSTSKLNSGGPSTCPKGSQVGTGFLIAEVGLASDPSSKVLTCRVDLTVYNGGGNSLSYYVYANSANSNECPSSQVKPTAFAVKATEKGTTLVQTINVPFSVRHPGNSTTLDAATLQASVSIPAKSRKVKGKTVNLVESIACPLNHKRHISLKFTTENGKSQTATANAACS